MAPVAVKFRIAMSLFWTSCLITGTVQGEVRTYIVLPGESLSKILHKQGISVEDLYRGGHWLERNKKRNKIVKDWMLLQPGTQLSLELPDYLSVKSSHAPSSEPDPEDLSQKSDPSIESSMPADLKDANPASEIVKVSPIESPNESSRDSASGISASGIVEQAILMQKSVSRLGVRIKGFLPAFIDLGLENSSPLILPSNLGDIRLLWQKLSLGLSQSLHYDGFLAHLSAGMFLESTSVSIPLQNSLRQTTRRKVSSSGPGAYLGASLDRHVFERNLGLRVSWEQTPSDRVVSFSRADLQMNISLWSVGPWRLDAFGRYTLMTMRSQQSEAFQNLSMKSQLYIPAFGLGLSYEQ